MKDRFISDHFKFSDILYRIHCYNAFKEKDYYNMETYKQPGDTELLF
jgi:hypothetical protein